FTGSSAAAVAEICARLDGLPLAIELAAAWVRVLPPPSLLSRLGNRLQILVGGPTNLPTRQQTLRATLDWSYELLEPDEQVLFRRIAVFVGGCSLKAVQPICGTSESHEIDTLAGLKSVLDKASCGSAEMRMSRVSGCSRGAGNA